MKKIKLGFIPLTDCAPLVMAREKGLFEKYQLDVELVKEVSWANIRDKVAAGTLDGAQMLATMPIAATLGVGGPVIPMLSAMVMSLNGNAITISNKLFEQIRTIDRSCLTENPIMATGLKKVIESQKMAGKSKLRFAIVFPTSTHNYELRYWLASAGIDPDNDIELLVIPPQQMVDNLASGNIDGFCVGDPWNGLAVQQGLGHTLITKYEIWNNSPEKVFAVTQDWAEQNQETHKSILKALLEATKWLDADIANRQQTAHILSKEAYVNTNVDVIELSMTGTFQYDQESALVTMADFNVFHRYSANFPWRSQAVWWISQMIRWGHIREIFSIHEAVKAIYRPDIYRSAIDELGEIAPDGDYKTEGGHSGIWRLETENGPLTMGPDIFFDAKVYNAEDLADYLLSFDIQHPVIDVPRLRKN